MLRRTMALELGRAFVPEDPCPYLRDRPACLEYRHLAAVADTEWEAMLERGWRRSASYYFRPACAGCAECVSLRVPTQTFRMSKSQRRTWNRCGDFALKVGPPTCDPERLDLYNAWQAERVSLRGWPAAPYDAETYAATFCAPVPFAREMSYYRDNRLAAIGLVDVTPRALSSVFFFFHPSLAPRSPGTFGALAEIALARETGRDHVYFGYRVAGCPSVAYKAQFRPHELLARIPADDEPPDWRPAPNPVDAPATRG
jgi:arginine-tRNA-protein transferase